MCVVSFAQTHLFVFFCTVPLKSIDIDVNLSGFISHVNSTLKYENKGESPIEAVFTFPMDENSAVYKFEAEIEGRKIIAECQEKQQVILEVFDLDQF